MIRFSNSSGSAFSPFSVISFIKEFKSKVEYCNYDFFVIDNNSPNESKTVLESAKEEYGFAFFWNNVNAGYAAGNNIGLRYAAEHGYKYALIANNDLSICDSLFLNKLVNELECNTSLGWCGPQIIDIDGYAVAPYLKRPSFFNMTIGLFSRKKVTGKSSIVYRLHGCCMLLNVIDIKKCGFMDERTFLYFEEDILAERMLKQNKQAYFCSEASIIHLESMTVKKIASKHSLKKVGIVLKSMDIYLKNYLHYGLLKRFFCKFFRGTIVFFKG